MNFQNILFDVRNQIAFVTFNRPESMNAVNRQMAGELVDACQPYARQSIRAVLATRELANLLRVQPRSALLFVERVSYSQENVPVEFLRIYYRADRYVLYN